MRNAYVFLFIENNDIQCYISIISPFISKSFHSGDTLNQNIRRTRSVRNYPAHTFQETLNIAAYIQKYGSEGSLLRISLADHLNMSPKSSNFTTLLSAGEQYKITSGRYNDEFINLTNLAVSILSPRSPEEKIEALSEAIYEPRKFHEFNALENEQGRTDEEFINSVVIRDISIHPDMANEYIRIYRTNQEYYDSILTSPIDQANRWPKHESKSATNGTNAKKTPYTPETSPEQNPSDHQILMISEHQSVISKQTEDFFTSLNLKVKQLKDYDLRDVIFSEEEKRNIKRVVIELPMNTQDLDLMSIGFATGLSFGLSGHPAIITGSGMTLASEISLLEQKAIFISYEGFNDMAVKLLLELQRSGNLNIALA